MTARPRTRLTLSALGAVAAVTLTACGGSGSGDTSSDAKASTSPAAPKGAVTPAEASKIVDAYEKVNSKANATQDEKLLSTVEGGQVHEQSKSDYTTFKTWSKEDQQDYKKPFTYTDREYYIPADEDWFAVKATASGTKTPGMFVFAKESKESTGTGAWKMVSAIYSDTPIPKIDTSNDGLATAVTPTTRVGTLAPNDISAAFEDLYATGGKKAATALTQTTEPAKSALKTYKERNDGNLSQYATKNFFAKTPAYDTTYALRLADGGVLAIVPTSHTSETLLKEKYRSAFTITPNDTESVYDPTKRVIITDTFQGILLATLPKSGKPSVIASEYGMTDSK
ncbi:hypothetical protein [Streptomyces sp. NPDC046909]|uniref:hypothetical protein n=1 Tax=Streptomyces sp. NPDC046909 TaxID=3155617 RepID=UPI0034066983